MNKPFWQGLSPLLALSILLSASTIVAAAPPAFPGAVGQGAASVGGRGGDVYHVTTLDDYATKRDEPKIEGSLRHALRSATGPRTVVFDVSGVIRLRERLEINKNLVTIAGQTSPGGITLFGYPLEVSGAHDLVVRYLRVRCGDLNARNRSGPGPAGAGDLDASSANAIHLGDGAERVIFDHVSACWGMDETLSVTRARDVTVQNCLIAEALDGSFHKKGSHGYGSLIRGELTEDDQRAGRGGYTLYRNLWAHNRARNPSIGGSQRLRKGQTEADRGRSDVNVVNTVVYDWGDQAIHRSNQGSVRINLIGNYYIAGNAKKAKYFFRGGGGPNSPTQVFQRGNRFDPDQDKAHDGVACDSDELVEAWFHDLEDDDRVRSTGEPFGFVASIPADTLANAEAAYERVLSGVGASLWRDTIDRRIIDSVSERTGDVIDTQEVFRREDDVMPGIDDLGETHRGSDFDTDQDGMADAFERANGLDPSDPEDRNGTELSDRSGATRLTNLEVYLDSLARPQAQRHSPVGN